MKHSVLNNFYQVRYDENREIIVEEISQPRRF